ncbi:MAG: stage 0 sporulation family protein, partial [Nitrospirae bacterium]|nr:stage 0 sporulation family protein [Nitrospirota bacterium]
LKKIIRKATEEDNKRIQNNIKTEKEVLEYCSERIENRKLPMKIVDVGSLLDSSKLIFYFTAEGRVDFRELVKDMAYKFRARIEMIQISVRDGARMISGYGPCGKQLCCASFLSDFEPITIRMARHQDMILNPAKISGMCGKLMCCIGFEYEACGDNKGHKSCPKNKKHNKNPKNDKNDRNEKKDQ